VLIALTVVAQILVALLVVLATNFLPATYIDQYGGLYAAFRAGIVALLGNQSVYFLMIRGAQNDRQGSHG